MLAAVFQPTHRHSKADGEPGQRDLFAAEQTLVAETAADIGGNHANRAVAEAQAFGYAALHDMRHLRRRDQREKTQPRMPLRDNAATLHRKHALSRCADLACDLDVGGVSHSLNRAILGKFDKDVVAPLLVH